MLSETYCTGVLISWAMPAASCPIAESFSCLHGHPAIADIASGDDAGLDLAVRVTDETAMGFQGDVGSVLSSHSVFDDLANASLETFLQQPGPPGAGRRGGSAGKKWCFQFFLCIAQETLIRGVVIDAVAGLVDNGNQIGTVLCDGAEQLVRPVFCLFRPLALRDIAIDDDKVLDPTLFVWNRGGD